MLAAANSLLPPTDDFPETKYIESCSKSTMKLFYFFTLIIEALRVESSRMAFNVVRRELIQFVETVWKL